jgi:hypothetical protein
VLIDRERQKIIEGGGGVGGGGGGGGGGDGKWVYILVVRMECIF